MKTTLLLLFFSLLTASLTMAQDSKRTQIYVRVGGGFSWATGFDVSNQSFLNGLGVKTYELDYINASAGDKGLLTGQFGISATVPISRRLSFQVETNLEQKGSGINVNWRSYGGIESDKVSGHFAARLLYLTVPVMLNYRFRRVAIYAGPYIGYKLRERQTGQYTTLLNSVPVALNRDISRYNSVDLGLGGGVWYAILKRVTVDLRYSQSLRSSAQPDMIPRSEMIYNHALSIGLMYAINR